MSETFSQIRAAKEKAGSNEPAFWLPLVHIRAAEQNISMGKFS